jgi:hypothetical protein
MRQKTPRISFRKWIESHHPSAFLLATQFILLILYAVFDGLHSQRAVLSAFGGLILMLIVWVVDRSPAVNWVAWVLAIPAFVLSILSAFFDAPFLLAWSAVLVALLYFYAAGSLIAYMMRDTTVTTDELFAAGATFTLLAWGYAYVYLVLQAWVPNSFYNGARPGEAATFVELLFLSFTNLSATGLGDIMPISVPARVVAMLEQFSGVGYVTVVVSRLIGMTINSREKKRH